MLRIQKKRVSILKRIGILFVEVFTIKKQVKIIHIEVKIVYTFLHLISLQ